MDNLFQYFMYKIFGRVWIMHMIREGSKQAIFAMALDVEQYFEKTKNADARMSEIGERLEKMPKTGLSAEGQKKLEEVQDELANAKTDFELAHSEYMRRSNELVRARERLEHVLNTSIKSIENKYQL